MGIYCVAHHICSPIGATSQANFEAIMDGKSALRLHSDRFELVEPFCVSLFDEPKSFTQWCILSIEQALQQTQIDPTSQRVIFVISTTKGDNLQLSEPAMQIQAHFRNPNLPIVVSNACTSGVCAQITAMRLIESGACDTAIVVGCDVQTPFIVSGFQALKALSQQLCKPFDKQRDGLNLGEAVATMIYTNQKPDKLCWQLVAGSICNDANHISAPSRTAEGSFRCLQEILPYAEQIDMISTHGTGTLYNDAMEAVAIHRAGLDEVPIGALKGFYGHTMGAAGVLETIISMLCLEHKIIPAARGYEENGVEYPLNLSPKNRDLDHEPHDLIKMLSGFGGVNAAILLRYVNE